MTYLDAKRLSGTSTDVVETLTFSDDFSSDNFTHTTPSQTSVTGGVLEIKHRLTTTADHAWRSLGTTLGTKWVMRFKINTSVRSSSASNPNTVGLFTLSAGNTNDMTVNGIGFRVQLGAPTEIYGIAIAGGSSNQSGAESYVWSSDSSTSVINTGITKWVELIRNESNLSLKIFSDEFITLQETLSTTFTGTISGLQYFTYKNRANNTASHTATINIDNLKIYNGVSSLTNKPVKAVTLTGCKAYYKFEEASGNLINQATTANGFSNGLGSSADGTPSGGVTQTATGKLGNAWSFDGVNDAITIGSSTSQFNFLHTPNTKFSINFWFKYLGSGVQNIFDTNSGGGTARVGLVIDMNANNVMSVYMFNGQAGQTIIGFNSTTNFIPDTNWHMINITYDHTLASGNIRVSIDNGTVQTANKTANTPSSSNASYPLSLMTYANNLGAYCNGNLDEFSIFDRVLTSSEISTLYNAGSGYSLTGQAEPQTSSIFTETDTGRIYWYDGNAWTKTISLSGLKAYYKFEEASGNLINQATVIGSTDSSGSTVNGTAANLTYSQAGKIGNACGFNASNSSVETAGDIMPSTFTAMTINAWIKPSSVRASYAVGTSPYDGNTNNWFNIQTGAGGKIQYAGGTNAAQDYLDSTTSYSTSQYQMVTLVYDGSLSGTNKLKGYFNGTQEGTSQGIIATSHTQSTRLSIGKQGNSGQPFFGGNIDEVSFWNRALSAAEITKLYNSGNGKAL